MARRRNQVRDLVVQDILGGTLRPGAQLKIQQLADRLRLSPIPIREILSRMVGEAVLTERFGVGYFVPRLHVHELAQIYRMRLLLLTGAAGPALEMSREPAIARAEQDDPPATVDLLMSSLIAAAGDAMIATAWALTENRLLPYRRCEPPVDAADTNVRDLRRAIAMHDMSVVRRIAARHLRRRERQCEAILRCAGTGEIS